MNFFSQPVLQKTTDIGVVQNTASLSAFLEPDCAGLIWQRQTPPEVQNWLDQTDPVLLPRGRVILQPDAVRDTVAHLCDMSGLPSGAEQNWLAEEAAYLADTFAALMDVRYLRLRLDVISTNACRKFHVDAISARLICTWRGTGTQYGFSVNNTEPERIQTVRTGSPFLMRGTLWPAEPSPGLLHRSPPIEGTGETRLVLVLDPVLDPEGDETQRAAMH